MYEDWKDRSIEATVASKRGIKLKIVNVRNERVANEIDLQRDYFLDLGNPTPETP